MARDRSMQLYAATPLIHSGQLSERARVRQPGVHASFVPLVTTPMSRHADVPLMRPRPCCPSSVPPDLHSSLLPYSASRSKGRGARQQFSIPSRAHPPYSLPHVGRPRGSASSLRTHASSSVGSTCTHTLAQQHAVERAHRPPRIRRRHHFSKVLIPGRSCAIQSCQCSLCQHLSAVGHSHRRPLHVRCAYANGQCVTNS